MTNDKSTPTTVEYPVYYEQITPVWVLKIHPNKDERMKIIVKAVNNFDSLLEACQLVLDRIAERGQLDHVTDEAVIETLEQAINQAKG